MDDLLDQIIDRVEALVDADLDLSSIKAGARHSASDTAMVQAIYDAAEDICELAVRLGATPEESEEDESEIGETIERVAGVTKQATFGGKPRDELEDDDFAGPNRTFPIVTAQDVKDAARLIGKADDPEAVKRKIIAIAKRKGFELPEAWTEAKKSTEDDTPAYLYGSEIKALDNGRIGGYAVLFGSADMHDLSNERDYFTKSTDFWLDKFGWPRPMTYHHGLDPDLQDDPIVGTWTKATVDSQGVWLEGQLDKAHRYHSAVKELVRRGYLKLSSDSAPQWVRRERQSNGANEVKRWPLLTASPTVTPAEPRLSSISFKSLMAEIGLEDIDDSPEADEAKAARADVLEAAETERTRRLLLQAKLLSLQE